MKKYKVGHMVKLLCRIVFTVGVGILSISTFLAILSYNRWLGLGALLVMIALIVNDVVNELK